LLNLTLAASHGRWQPNLRTFIKGRFLDDLIAPARLRSRPVIDFTLPIRMSRPPVLVVNNEFFVVPGTNNFAAVSSYTQNRFQIGVRLPIAEPFSARPYYLLQSLNEPTGWDTNQTFGVSLVIKLPSRNN